MTIGDIVKVQGPPRGFSFWLGVVLMALSFGIYLAYAAVPFLSISVWRKGGVTVGLSAVSWGIFLLGSLLAGKEGVAYLKRRFSKRRKPQRDREGTRLP